MVSALTWDEFAKAAEAPTRIVFLIVMGIVLRLVVQRVIDRLVAKAAGLAPPKHLFGSKRAAQIIGNSSTLYNERRGQRAQALGSLFKSITTVVVGGMVALMVLNELSFQLGPVLASAGVVGVALGFGAQNLVKDFISGVFMLLEDQYGVGDVIDMGQATGTVEGVGLRVTRLRDGDGILWHVRNGEIIRVGNRSQGWSSLVLDVSVAYDEDIPRLEGLINDVARSLADEEEWRDRILEAPHVVGLEQINGAAVTIRVVGRCAPNEQFGVQRELRLRLKDVFDREGVRVPAPLWPGQSAGAAGAVDVPS
ncbi:mechanosensitive ion channel family protein [Actinopolymorpha alba]|uniref:mechanosensitive ion channel family protein n=1 Tax=Actinopolymorpha alba TaxID=533267 RepID=UPI0012F6BB84|nr:mechanosensitive ion channel family protein [Actinopolymorpha alba]